MTHGRVRRAGFLSRQPGDDVALGVPTPEVLQNQVTATPAQVDGQLVGERQRGPGQAGHRVGLLSQPGHPPELAYPVLLAALRSAPGYCRA